MMPSTMRPIRYVALIFLVLACAGCSGGDQPAGGIDEAPVSVFDLSTAGELPGWTRLAEVDHFSADNLWEYINGQADFFIDYGFVEVETAEYRNDRTAGSVVVEIYHMGSPPEGFGIFAAERTREDRSIEIGSGAFLGPNVLGFWQEEYYVKVTSFEEGPEIEGLLVSMAEEISARLPGGKRVLDSLLLFPKEGRVEASERFIPKNFLGQPYLTDAYQVDYVVDDQPVQLFVMEAASAADAASRFEQFEEFQRARGQGSVTLETVQATPILVVDGPSKMVVFQLDHYLGGAVGIHELEIGRSAAAALAESIGG
jgi:hypothetical protein